MLTQYSLKEFHDKVRELANKVDKDYIGIQIAMNNDGALTFSCYIDGYSYVNGKTPDEALQNMRNLMLPSPKIISENDVIIEMVTPSELE